MTGVEIKQQRREVLEAAHDVLCEFGLHEMADDIRSTMNGLMADAGFVDVIDDEGVWS